MANIDEAFNAKFENTIKLNNHNDIIDHFFTQRRVTEHEDIIDKNMNRSKKKRDITYNFIAITIPYYEYIGCNKVEIEIKIWGDEGFKYTGNILAKEGYIPSLLLKLNTDKELFVNLKIKYNSSDDHHEKEYVTFINIPKRYQIEPTIQVNV
jgi:hypothetical protein